MIRVHSLWSAPLFAVAMCCDSSIANAIQIGLDCNITITGKGEPVEILRYRFTVDNDAWARMDDQGEPFPGERGNTKIEGISIVLYVDWRAANTPIGVDFY